MDVPGLKSCYDKTRGLFYFPRMCSKIRLRAADALPEDYFAMLGDGFDGRICRFLSVSYEDVKQQVLSDRDDSEVLDWCFDNGRRPTDEEVLIFNSFISKRGWRDDETDAFLPGIIRSYGVADIRPTPHRFRRHRKGRGPLATRHVARRLARRRRMRLIGAPAKSPTRD